MIIRQEERRHTGETRASLHNHRVYDVRNEQRATLLAYGFLRGRQLTRIECKPDRSHGLFRQALKRAERIAEKYGRQDVRIIRQKFEEWTTCG